MLRLIRRKLAAGLVARGVSQRDADTAVAELGDGLILRWLADHGPDLLGLIAALLAMFAAVPEAGYIGPTPTPLQA